MKNGIQDLRDHLFATLEALKDKDAPMEVERAAAISDVAGKIIDSARVEVDMVRALNQAGVTVAGAPTKFLQLERPDATAPANGQRRPT